VITFGMPIRRHGEVETIYTTYPRPRPTALKEGFGMVNSNVGP
jgi:hypothetical protein